MDERGFKETSTFEIDSTCRHKMSFASIDSIFTALFRGTCLLFILHALLPHLLQKSEIRSIHDEKN